MVYRIILFIQRGVRSEAVVIIPIIPTIQIMEVEVFVLILVGITSPYSLRIWERSPVPSIHLIGLITTVLILQIIANGQLILNRRTTAIENVAVRIVGIGSNHPLVFHI